MPLQKSSITRVSLISPDDQKRKMMEVADILDSRSISSSNQWNNYYHRCFSFSGLSAIYIYTRTMVFVDHSNGYTNYEANIL